jgi:6-pyruvoyltetrahydropterin/6-carboxytetrahydropterin synthase
MYEITVEETFDAAHCLPDYEGNCSRLHGHTYRVMARFRYPSLGDSGMAIDFRKAKSALHAATSHMDHQYINELPAFSGQTPTAEHIARFVYDCIRAEYPQVHSVSVWETPTSCATYYEEV